MSPVRVLFVCWSCAFLFVLIPAEFRYTFVTTPVCQDDYGTILGTYYVRSHAECYLRCLTDGECLSLVFDAAEQTCRTNAASMDRPEYCYMSTLRYGEMVHRMEGACVLNTECNASHWECRDTVCQCEPGYSFRASTNSCLANCSTYGDTFSEHKSHVLDGFNEEFTVTATSEGCEALCLNASTFLCRSYEYRWPASECYLHSETALTQPQAYFYDSTYSVFQRNCA